MDDKELEMRVIALRDQANAFLAENMPVLENLRSKDLSQFTPEEWEMVYAAFATMMGNLHSGYWSLEE